MILKEVSMAIERYKPKDQDKIVFSFLTPAEGRDALKMAIDLVAGQCGEFVLIPIGDADKDIYVDRGYVGFGIRGNKNALLPMTYPLVRDQLKESLGLSDDELDSMVWPQVRLHPWFDRPSEQGAAKED